MNDSEIREARQIARKMIAAGLTSSSIIYSGVKFTCSELAVKTMLIVPPAINSIALMS